MRFALTIQNAIDSPLMRSPIPPQLASLEHLYVMMSGMQGVPLRWFSVHTHVLMMCCIKYVNRCLPADRCASFNHLRTGKLRAVRDAPATCWHEHLSKTTVVALSRVINPQREQRRALACRMTIAWAWHAADGSWRVKRTTIY